ncbi:MAG: peptidylprolyl isomerase [Magnetospiraceae bacterium]
MTYLNKLLPAALLSVGTLISAVAWAQDDADPIAATVNGQEIRQSDVRAVLPLLPQQYQQLPFEMIYPMLLDSVVDRRILSDAARAEGYAEKPEVKENLRRVEEQLLQNMIITDHVEKAVTDDLVREAYEAKVAGTPPEDEIKASHILLETEEAAKEVIEALKGGADFVELAKEKSTGPSGPNGGDLGYFTQGAMVPEFGDAAFGMKVGTFSEEPVQTQFGWHVIQVNDRRKTEPPTFEESEAELRNTLARQVSDKYIAELRGKVAVTKFNLDGTEITAADAEEPKEESKK